MMRHLLVLSILCSMPAWSQLSATGNEFITLASPGVPGAPSEDDTMGRALATGDFDGDGYEDLAVGVPGDQYAAPQPDVPGKVIVLYGTPSGFDPLRTRVLTQADCGLQANCIQLVGDAELNQNFGFVLAAGDFNHDNYDDLAIGVPWVNSLAGEVVVAYGGVGGLSAEGDQLWSQADEDLTGQAESGDLFGLSLAACDFNGDGSDDLAIGVPGENINPGGGDINDAGAFMVLHGSEAFGLTTLEQQFWSQSNNVTGAAEALSVLGAALACGDFDGDGYADLAASAPWADVDGVNKAGRVHEIHGSSIGLDSGSQTVWDRDAPTESEQVGQVLITGNFNGDAYDDVVFGMPFKTIDGHPGAGEANVLFGTSAGLTGSGFQELNEESAPLHGISNGADTNDLIGYGMAAGDFNQDGFDDLALSIPGQTVSGNADAGAIRILPGRALMTPLAPLGGVTTDNAQLFTQNTVGVADQSEVSDQIGLPWPNELGRSGASFFGNPAATGDFNGDGFDDFAVGVPLEDLVDPDTGPIPNAGGVIVLYGGRLPPTDLGLKINGLHGTIQDLQNLVP